MSKILLVITSILFFLRPHPDFLGFFVATYLGDLTMFSIMVYSLLVIPKKIYYKHKLLLYTSFMSMVMLLLPTVINFYITGYLEIWVDYGKIVYFVLLFWFLYLLLINIKAYTSLIPKIINGTFLIIFIISIVQLFDPPLVGEIIKKIYGTVKLRTIWTGYPRVYGTFFNANWFGVYLVFYFTWLNGNLMYKTINIRKYIIKILLTSILLVLSGSRTAIIGVIIASFCQLIDRKQIKNVLIFSIFAMLIFLIIGYFGESLDLLSRTLDRFVSTFNIFKEEGLVMHRLNPGRWKTWLYTYNKFIENPILGSGYVGDIIPHNSYLYFLNMFGLIGVLCIVIPWGVYYYSKKRLTYNGQCNVVKRWKRGFVPAFLIMSLTAEFFFTTQVVFLIIFIYVLGIFNFQLENEQYEGGME